MNLSHYLSIAPEIEAAVREGKPVVALESTILSHGLPWPQNLEFAYRVQSLIRGHGVVPATTAVINGRLRVGLEDFELESLCRGTNIEKASRRDLPILVATGKTGATTVASTMILASLAGIRVFSTGGIGGVHRGAQTSMDISADLQELAHTPVAVVCAGAKMILDIGLTLEYLETMGVPVLGMRSEDFPAFYCRKSGYGVDYAVKDEQEAARIIKTKWDLGLTGGVLIANPVPEQYALDFDEMDRIIQMALEDAQRNKITGTRLTPYLLDKLLQYTDGKSLSTNLQLAYHNACTAAKIAVEFSRL